MDVFESRVAGIPCQIEVTHYSPELPMRITGSGYGDADPPEPEEFLFTVLDRKGYPAPWLVAGHKLQHHYQLTFFQWP